MLTMIIRAINATFESVSSGDYRSQEDAYSAAIRAAMEIASSEVSSGATSSLVHISVEDGEGLVKVRGAVSASTARLLI